MKQYLSWKCVANSDIFYFIFIFPASTTRLILGSFYGFWPKDGKTQTDGIFKSAASFAKGTNSWTPPKAIELESMENGSQKAAF